MIGVARQWYGLRLQTRPCPRSQPSPGHSLHDVEAILDAHYLGRDANLAEIAIMELETRTKL